MCSETKRMRSHNSSIFHHRSGDIFQVVEELSAGARLKILDVLHDSVMCLKEKEKIKF